MPALTSRRSRDAHAESWQIFYGDVHVGTIGVRAGVPNDVDQWGWSCGFYPGSEPATAARRPLFGVPRLPLEHFQLNLIRKAAEVHSPSIEHFPFSFVRSEVSDPGAFGCVPAELFQMGLIVLHGAPDCYFGGCSSLL